MIRTLEDLCSFVYNIKGSWGSDLDEAIDRSGLSLSTSIGISDTFASVSNMVLHLDETVDLFLVFSSNTGWYRITNDEAGRVEIGEGQLFTKAIYVQWEGDYFYVVGDIEESNTILTKEVPPL